MAGIPISLLYLLQAVGGLVVYLTLGVVLARRRAVRIYHKHLADQRRRYSGSEDRFVINNAEYWARDELRIFVCIWPVIVVREFITGRLAGRDLLLGPVIARREQAAKLRAEAKGWDEYPAKTSVEEEMARGLAQMLREKAKELES